VEEHRICISCFKQ